QAQTLLIPTTTLENLPDKVQSPTYLPITNLQDKAHYLPDKVQSLTYLPITNLQDKVHYLLDKGIYILFLSKEIFPISYSSITNISTYHKFTDEAHHLPDKVQSPTYLPNSNLVEKAHYLHDE
ncbi:unnamed protein product, partial [Gordionus sp. m RMFG-2023]